MENVHADIRIKGFEGSHTCKRPSKGEYGVALPPVYDSDSSPLVRNKYHFNKQRGIKIELSQSQTVALFLPISVDCRCFNFGRRLPPVFGTMSLVASTPALGGHT